MHACVMKQLISTNEWITERLIYTQSGTFLKKNQSLRTLNLTDQVHRRKLVLSGKESGFFTLSFTVSKRITSRERIFNFLKGVKVEHHYKFHIYALI